VNGRSAEANTLIAHGLDVTVNEIERGHFDRLQEALRAHLATGAE